MTAGASEGDGAAVEPGPATAPTRGRELSRRDAAILLLLAIVLGALAEASRLPMRWGPVALAYGAYVAEWRQAVSVDGRWLTTWVGLHPPLFAWLFTTALTLGLPPLGWLAASGLASLSAVGTVAAAVRLALGRPGRAAALLAAGFVALSPHRLAYALEVNNYPLLVGALGAQMAAFALWARSGRRAPLVLGSALLPWAHLLGATAILGQGIAVALVRPRRLRAFLGVEAVAAVAMLPLLPGLARAIGDPINEHRGWGAALGALLLDLPGRYGLGVMGWAVLGLAVLGAWDAWRAEDHLIPLSWALSAAVGALAVLGAQASAQASAAQLPYWLVPLLPTLALAGAALRGRETDQRVAAAALAILLGNGAALGLDALDAGWTWSRAEAALPLSVAAARSWSPGEALLLLGLPSSGDDDKAAVDPVFSAVPWGEALDYLDPGIPGLTPADPYWGQPVLLRDGRWLYTFATVNVPRLRRIAETHRGRGQGVRVAAYGLRSAADASALLAWARSEGREPAVGPGELAFALPASPGLNPPDPEARGAGGSPRR